MGWETDLPPINYLKRRIIYYKKKRGAVKNMIKDEWMVNRYGGIEEFQKLIDTRILNIEKRIKEFEGAVKKLGGKL